MTIKNIYFSGCSGVGKTYFVERLIRENPDKNFKYVGSIARGLISEGIDFNNLSMHEKQKTLVNRWTERRNLTEKETRINDRSVFDYLSWSQLYDKHFDFYRDKKKLKLISDDDLLIKINPPSLKWFKSHFDHFSPKKDKIRSDAYTYAVNSYLDEDFISPLRIKRITDTLDILIESMIDLSEVKNVIRVNVGSDFEWQEEVLSKIKHFEFYKNEKEITVN